MDQPKRYLQRYRCRQSQFPIRNSPPATVLWCPCSFISVRMTTRFCEISVLIKWIRSLTSDRLLLLRTPDQPVYRDAGFRLHQEIYRQLRHCHCPAYAIHPFGHFSTGIFLLPERCQDEGPGDPEIDGLKAKFGDDQQAFGLEQMKLFREAGVNPLGAVSPRCCRSRSLCAI